MYTKINVGGERGDAEEWRVSVCGCLCHLNFNFNLHGVPEAEITRPRRGLAYWLHRLCLPALSLSDAKVGEKLAMSLKHGTNRINTVLLVGYKALLRQLITASNSTRHVT